jgi:chromosomal replication initiation ATPase DnaA
MSEQENIQGTEIISKMAELQAMLLRVMPLIPSVPYQKFLKDAINTTVCDVFVITQKDLFSGSGKGNRVDAVAVTCILYKHYLKFSRSMLVNEFGKKSEGSINFYYNKLRSLDENIPQDRKLLDKMNVITSKIENQIKTYNLNH